MAGNRRGMNDALAEALSLMAAAMREQTKTIRQLRGSNIPATTTVDPQYVRISEFRKNNPPPFRGSSDPVEAEEWLLKLEKIFRVMRCSDGQRVDLVVYMLESDAEHWWNCARGGLLTQGVPITWDGFKEIFLGKYFTHNDRIQKETEFLNLRQGDMSVAEYVAKFEALSRVAEQKMQALEAEKPKEKFNPVGKRFHNKDNKFQKNLRPVPTISKDKL
uniref:Uncharacterized protein LOC101501792 n=1 Tax=Cicer arietinum TaxID=3827 RepID=A0A1S2Z5S1_CICAR|nr:uncharacterized protein LOC101501792 [Cicer arietinum]